MALRREKYTRYYQGGYKKNAIKIARQLGHPEEVIEKLRNAKNDSEVATIMHVAAKNIGEK